MKEIEIERMIHFLYRMQMYILDSNKENIISFMHGADFGKLNDPFWTQLLHNFISNKYQIDGGAMGWPYQVEVFSNREKIEWTEGFIKLMIKMIRESDEIPFTEDTQELIKKMILLKKENK
ncbi:hypothetical protein [Tenacibaculum agarivorans]|uniref:hypothetical protein n=1 Tax=Tenacibaculum agarivorans TaxID=1908389 RepID=UPI00094B7D7E|nr:hypothetical protein [Tenacibaculum agarivorans]